MTTSQDRARVDDYPNLEACCGGAINPDSLRRFKLAMHEYERFMDGLERLFAPRQ